MHTCSVAVPLSPCLSVCTRLKEAENKKKKTFTIKSLSKKEQQKYYDMILKKLESYITLETTEIEDTENNNSKLSNWTLYNSYTENSPIHVHWYIDSLYMSTGIDLLYTSPLVLF